MTPENQMDRRRAIQKAHPEWATAEGRVKDESARTMAAFALGETPQTVLGGLLVRRVFQQGGLSVGAIAANIHMDPRHINHRGDTFHQVLSDLVEVGWVQAIDPPSIDSWDESEAALASRRYELTGAFEVRPPER